jgi:hypothetical protein
MLFLSQAVTNNTDIGLQGKNVSRFEEKSKLEHKYCQDHFHIILAIFMGDLNFY